MGSGSSKIECSVLSIQKLHKENVTQSLGPASTKSGRKQSSVNSIEYKKLRSELTKYLLEEVDLKTKEIQSSTYISVEQLANDFNQIADTSILKICCIWLWITQHIQQNADSTFDNSNVADDVMLDKTSNSIGFAKLFKSFAEYCGIRCETISGWSKLYCTNGHLKFQKDSPNHAWNSVYLDKKWMILDTYWGSGYLDENKNFIKSYDESFFLIDPNHRITDHYPLDSKWQLLDVPIEFEEFEQYLYFSRHFSQFHIRPLTHEYSTITFDSNKLHLKFKMDKESQLLFTGTLSKKDAKMESTSNLYIYTSGKVLHAVVSFPCDGSFLLKLFAQNTHASLKYFLCSYIIDRTCKEGDTKAACSVYPKKHKMYLPGFHLFSPTEGHLSVGKTCHFKMSLPGVADIAVCTGGTQSRWFPMSNVRASVWLTDVTIPKGTKRITVVAKFSNSGNTTYSSVLEYQVCNI